LDYLYIRLNDFITATDQKKLLEHLNVNKDNIFYNRTVKLKNVNNEREHNKFIHAMIKLISNENHVLHVYNLQVLLATIDDFKYFYEAVITNQLDIVLHQENIDTRTAEGRNYFNAMETILKFYNYVPENLKSARMNLDCKRKREFAARDILHNTNKKDLRERYGVCEKTVELIKKSIHKDAQQSNSFMRFAKFIGMR